MRDHTDYVMWDARAIQLRKTTYVSLFFFDNRTTEDPVAINVTYRPMFCFTSFIQSLTFASKDHDRYRSSTIYFVQCSGKESKKLVLLLFLRTEANDVLVKLQQGVRELFNRLVCNRSNAVCILMLVLSLYLPIKKHTSVSSSTKIVATDVGFHIDRNRTEATRHRV